MKRVLKKGFKSWLESKKPNAIVGVTDDGCNCPVANYVKAKSGESTAWVSQSMVNAGGWKIYGGDLPKTPRWIREFVVAVDLSGVKKIERKVTAKKALTILSRIK